MPSNGCPPFRRGGGASDVDMISTTPTLFSQRAEPSPLWSIASPKRRITPVAVASRAIEATVMGEGEGSGGDDGGGSGNSPGPGFEGAEPLASPSVITLGRLAPLYYALRHRPRRPRLAPRSGVPHTPRLTESAGSG